MKTLAALGPGHAAACYVLAGWSRIRRPSVCGALASCWLLVASTVVPAQASRTGGPSVRVVYAASDEIAPQLEQTLRSESRLPGARASVERSSAIDPSALLSLSAEGSSALARIFVDVTRADRAWVFVVGRDSSRLFARSLPRVGSAVVDVAQIGEIVRSSVQALAAGAQVGLSPPPDAAVSAVRAEEAPAADLPPTATGPSPPRPDGAPFTTAPKAYRRRPPPLAAPASVPEWDAAAAARVPASERVAPSATQWLAGLLYGVGMRSSGGELAHGPGVYTGLRFGQSELRAGGLVSAQFEPRRIARPGVSAQLSSCVLRAGPLLDWTVGSHAALGFALFAGAELLRASVQTSRSDWIVDPGQASVAALARLGAQLSFQLRAAEHLELAVSLVGDVDLVDTRFVVRSQLGDAVVDQPWRVRPSLVLAVGWY
jgi:hypothetical protein